MKITERNRIRKLQDQLIDLVKARGLSLDLAINSYYPEPTIRQLQDTLWPQYEHIIKAAIVELTT